MTPIAGWRRTRYSVTQTTTGLVLPSNLMPPTRRSTPLFAHAVRVTAVPCAPSRNGCSPSRARCSSRRPSTNRVTRQSPVQPDSRWPLSLHSGYRAWTAHPGRAQATDGLAPRAGADLNESESRDHILTPDSFMGVQHPVRTSETALRGDHVQPHSPVEHVFTSDVVSSLGPEHRSPICHSGLGNTAVSPLTKKRLQSPIGFNPSQEDECLPTTVSEPYA